MVLLTLVTGVMLMGGRLGRELTVKCISKTQGKTEYEEVMLKFGTRGLALNESQTFEVIPNTKVPPMKVQIQDIRQGVTQGCQIELVVKGAEGMNLQIFEPDANDQTQLNESIVDVGLTKNQTDWLDDMPLKAIAMFGVDNKFNQNMCNSSLYQNDNWIPFYAKEYDYFPLVAQRPNNKYPKPTDEGIVAQYIDAVNYLVGPYVDPVVKYVATNEDDPDDSFVPDYKPLKMDGRLYCFIVEPIQSEVELHESELQHAKDQLEAMERARLAKEQGLDGGRVLLV